MTLAIDPVLDIKANNHDGQTTIFSGEKLSITASLNPGTNEGDNGDWWVAATSPFGLYWLTLDRGWVASLKPIPIYGGPLFNLDSYIIVESNTLPVGGYVFYFSIDGNMDGVLDATHIDSVNVRITD